MRFIQLLFLPVCSSFLNNHIIPCLKRDFQVKKYREKIIFSNKYIYPVKVTQPYTQIIKDVKQLSLPLLVISASNPILSLIDTISVGKVSSVIELASLGPATSLCDTGGNIFAFISVVTTCRVAKAFAKKDDRKMNYLLNDSFFISFVCGSIVSITMFNSFGVSILRLFLGNPSISSETALLVPGAMKYIKIRMIGYIPALMTSQLQSYTLAKRNVKFPLKTVGFTALINIIADYILVIVMKFGLVGAAWATVFAQISTFVYMISYLIKQKENNYEQRMLKRRMKDIGIFLKRCIGPAVANIGRTGILIMTSSLCSCCGTVSVAAHQVILSWFYLFCPIGEAVSQTVLNLFPSYLSTKEQKFTKETWSFISTMCKIAFVFGIIDASSVMVPMYIPNIFTTSNEVSLVMRSLSPYLALALFGHVLASFFEGLLIATGDTKYLATMYSLNIIIIGYFYNKLSLINVNVLWMIYVSSIGTRVIEFSFRFLWRHGKR